MVKLSGHHKIISQWAHLFCKEETHNLVGWKMCWLFIVTDFICKEYHDFTSAVALISLVKHLSWSKGSCSYNASHVLKRAIEQICNAGSRLPVKAMGESVCPECIAAREPGCSLKMTQRRWYSCPKWLQLVERDVGNSSWECAAAMWLPEVCRCGLVKKQAAIIAPRTLREFTSSLVFSTLFQTS